MRDQALPTPTPTDWRARLREAFSLDLRTLALWRVALGCILLIDLWDRSRHFAAHYLESGVLPVEALAGIYGAGVHLSAHVLASHSALLEGSLFALHAAAAVAIVVGWKTRWALLLAFYLVVSVQVRNPYVSGMSGDMILRVQLMWALFLPVDARFSLAARERRARGERLDGERIFSAGTVALLLQLGVIYLSAGLHKFTPSWNDGTAVYYVMHLDDWNQQRLAPLLLGQPMLLFVLAHATRVVEIAGPFLLYLPRYTAWGRLAAFLSFVAFHLGTVVFLSIGLFPWISMVIWLSCLPGALWDEWLPRLGFARARSEHGAREVPTRLPRAARFLIIAILAYVGVQQTANLLRVDLPAPIYRVGQALRLNQHWKMFAPPAKADQWLVVDGEMRNGLRVDPYRGRSVDWSKPIVAESFPNFRWRLYVLLGIMPANPLPTRDLLYPPFGDWLCRQWNARYDDERQLVSLTVWGMLERTLPPPQGAAPIERFAIAQHRCDTGDPGQRAAGPSR